MTATDVSAAGAVSRQSAIKTILQYADAAEQRQHPKMARNFRMVAQQVEAHELSPAEGLQEALYQAHWESQGLERPRGQEAIETITVVETTAPTDEPPSATEEAILEQQERLEERVEEIEQRFTLPTSPGLTVAEWVSGIHDLAGYCYDEAAALSCQCTRVDLGDGLFLIFSDGIVGALTPEQERQYCALGYDDKTPTEADRQRYLALADSAKACTITGDQLNGSPPEGHLHVYFTCLGAELRKRSPAT